jgi:hypothetical protein
MSVPSEIDLVAMIALYHLDTIALYRLENPRSRAVDHTTWSGSSAGVRRATCIYCRGVVATSSGKYPETLKSIRARHDHEDQCVARLELAYRYLSRVYCTEHADCRVSPELARACKLAKAQS